MFHQCATCNRNDVRLYRSYGMYLRKDAIFCKTHIPPEQVDWYVPLIEDTDGSVWGYTSCPNDAIERWKALPEL